MSIVVENLIKTYGRVAALHGVSLTVKDGSLTALLGPSGCGKTTLLRAIAGFETVDSGRILLDGKDATNLPIGERKAGFVFQHYALFPHLTVAQNIGFALDLRRRPKAEIDNRVAELLALMQLDGFGSRRPHQLSGGQRQRVALARALASEPSFLLLDEPFGALDLHVRRDLRRWLRELHDRTHLTTLLVTHDSEEALEIADDIIVLREGKVQQQGDPDSIYTRPANPFVMRFLGEVSTLERSPAPVYVRPAEVRVEAQAFADSLPASIVRTRKLGPRTQVELTLSDGQSLTASLENHRAASLSVRPGLTVYVEPASFHSFEGA